MEGFEYGVIIKAHTNPDRRNSPMSILKITLVACLLVTAAQAQTKPEQPSDAEKQEANKNSWEKKEAEIKALKAALAKNPKSPEAHYNLGRACLNGILHSSDAVAYFKQAVALKPDYAEAFLGLGDAYKRDTMFGLDGEQIGRAVDAYRRAISIRPDYFEAYVALGWAYLEGDAAKLAADTFKEAVRIRPEHARAYSGLGAAYQRFGMLEEAGVAYKQALKLTPNPRDRLLDLTMLQLVYMKLTKSDQRLDEYIDVVKQEIEIDSNRPFPYFILGDLYARTGRPEEAIEAYKKGISIKHQEPANRPIPKSLEFVAGRQRLGELYIKLGRYADAIEPCKQAIEENPKNRDAYRVLSGAYVKLNLSKEAVETSQQAVRILPDDPMVYYNLGITYVAVGEKESAMAQYQQLLRMAASVKKEAPKKSGNAYLDGRFERLSESSFEMKKRGFEMYAEWLLEKINGKL